MRDFTLQVYRTLCLELKVQVYETITFADYCSGSRSEKHVILRHDVDKAPGSALEMATLEEQLGLRTSYYFRFVDAGFDTETILNIADMGHEIGYHYEDLSVAKGSMQHAIELFKRNLSALRKLYPVKTICMHGSPLSKWDNRFLWEHYDYRDFGIIGEPYFDIDFNDILYLTDTGRSWNGLDTNIRDKVHSWEHNLGFKYTKDIIDALQGRTLPTRVMLNIHPQRWHDRFAPWLKELLWQNAKNVGKRILIARQ